MSCKVAGAIDPLEAGFAIAIAIVACWKMNDPGATEALFHDGMTLPAVVSASFFPHENALRTRLYRLTNHGYHLPSEIKYKKTRL